MIDFFGLALTLILYILALRIKKITFLKQIPPIILTGVTIIVLLKSLHIDYSLYNKSASILTFLLGPATIALAYPLNKNIDVLSVNKRAIWFGLAFATLLSVLSTYVVGRLFHSDFNVIMSMIPKSVTTPIALEISKSLGGIPELTATVVILTGIVGGLFGHRLLKLFNVKHDTSIGLSMGASSHIMGTARCLEKNQDKQAAISTLALIIVGLFTAIIAPILLHYLF